MKAAILMEPGQEMSIEDVGLDAPRGREVRVRVLASGLCHSDLNVVNGHLPHPLPVILGHEAAGIVEATGEDVRGLKNGDRVVCCLSTHCGECGECQGGYAFRCDDKPRREALLGSARITWAGAPVHQFGQLGAFAEEMLVHEHSLARIPDEIGFDVAALLGCAVMTGVGAVLNSADVRPGEMVAVFGCGGVGLNVIQGARIAGASRIIAIDVNPSKLKLAQLFGATDVILADADAVGKVVELTKGGVHYAFEVAGRLDTLRQGFLMLRKGGGLVIVGMPPYGTDIALPGLLFLQKNLRVLSCMMGSAPHQVAIPRYAQFYLNGQLKLGPMVSQHITLADVNRAYAQLEAGEVARSVITF